MKNVLCKLTARRLRIRIRGHATWQPRLVVFSINELQWQWVHSQKMTVARSASSTRECRASHTHEKQPTTKTPGIVITCSNSSALTHLKHANNAHTYTFPMAVELAMFAMRRWPVKLPHKSCSNWDSLDCSMDSWRQWKCTRRGS